MARSRKPAAIKWSRFRRHNLKLFLKPFCWTRRQARPGSCITKRGRRFNGFPFGFRLERTGLRLPCRRRRTPLAYRAERRATPNRPIPAKKWHWGAARSEGRTSTTDPDSTWLSGSSRACPPSGWRRCKGPSPSRSKARKAKLKAPAGCEPFLMARLTNGGSSHIRIPSL